MLEGMIKTDLKIIKGESGSVLHSIREKDPGYIKFGEVYFSSVNNNAIKAWKLHKEMTLNLTVPTGSVLFSFFDDRKASSTYNHSFQIILSKNPYFRLTVPPGIWFGFKGAGLGLNLICNLADIIHNPSEVIRKELKDINMDWSLK